MQRMSGISKLDALTASTLIMGESSVLIQTTNAAYIYKALISTYCLVLECISILSV